MDYNFHTHTWRCHHASGSMEEYVLEAINSGIKFMGFSDHVPFVCSNGSESTYRVSAAEAEDYCNEVVALAEKYKDKIDIIAGYEMEYYPNDFEKMLDTAIRTGGKYLILGEHFLEDESLGGHPSTFATDDCETLKKYCSRIVEAIATKKYTYVAHPDILNFTGDEEIYLNEMRKICAASKEYNIPLEINFLGIRDNRHYPNEKFLKLMGEEQNPVTFGCDAHSADVAFDEPSLKTALDYVEKYNLNYIGKPNLILINE